MHGLIFLLLSVFGYPDQATNIEPTPTPESNSFRTPQRRAEPIRQPVGPSHSSLSYPEHIRRLYDEVGQQAIPFDFDNPAPNQDQPEIILPTSTDTTYRPARELRPRLRRRRPRVNQ